MELWKSKKIWHLLFICCHVVVNTQFSFPIVYWLGHWCVTYFFLFMLIFTMKYLNIIYKKLIKT